MRCPKCGYVSFDYLDRCSKCQTDLTGERERLRLHGFRPDPLSLQELSDRLAAAQAKEKEAKEEAKGTTKGKEEGISFSLDLNIPEPPPSGPSSSPKPIDLEKELELTLEGLEINIHSDK